MDDPIDIVKSAFSNGKPVLIFDSEYREGETDLLYPAYSVSTENIRTLRQVCGGLLFLAIGDEVGERLGLPFLQDIHTKKSVKLEWPILDYLVTNDLKYDQRSAFTLSLNHRDTFTGITDSDRNLTVRRFAEFWQETQHIEKSDDVMRLFGMEFRTPGHVPVCKEAKGGLLKRQGHTELAVAMARISGVTPIVVGAEMLQPDGDFALSKEQAKLWGKENNVPFISGEMLLNAYAAGREISDE